MRRLVDAFYERLESDPDADGVRSLHGRDLALPRDRLPDRPSGRVGGAGGGKEWKKERRRRNAGTVAPQLRGRMEGNGGAMSLIRCR